MSGAGDHTCFRHAAQVAGVPPVLVGVVHDYADEFEAGVRDDGPQRPDPDLAGPPKDHLRFFTVATTRRLLTE